jgi:hypothetical protein
MSEINDFEQAVALLRNGRKRQAAKELWDLYFKVANKGFRLQIIDALVNALDPFKDLDRLVKTVSEGIGLSDQMNRGDVKAYLMGKKASLHMNEITILQYRQQNLRLHPAWIGFATEAEKAEYETIIEKIKEIERSAGALLDRAMQIAKEVGNKRVEACVWVSSGEVNVGRYMHFKMHAMMGSIGRAKWWHRLRLLRRYGFENYLFYDLRQIRELRNYISQFTKGLLRAASLFKELNDSGEAYTLYKLSNHLRTAFRFRQASRYLKRAEAVARKYNEELLLKHIEEMKKLVKDRNKGVPNYLEGETREEITLD